MHRNPHLSDLAAIASLGRADAHGRTRHRALARLQGRRLWPPAGARSAATRILRAYTPHGGSFNHKPGTAMHWLYMRVEGLLERATDVFTFESEFIADRYADLCRANRAL